MAEGRDWAEGQVASKGQVAAEGHVVAKGRAEGHVVAKGHVVSVDCVDDGFLYSLTKYSAIFAEVNGYFGIIGLNNQLVGKVRSCLHSLRTQPVDEFSLRMWDRVIFNNQLECGRRLVIEGQGVICFGSVS